jgi:membrane protein YdbS with pleckstrin-like domain
MDEPEKTNAEPPILGESLEPPASDRAAAGEHEAAMPRIGEFQRLDEGVIFLWRIHRAIQSMFFLGILLIPALILSFKFEAYLIWIWSGYGLFFLIQIFLWIWQPPANYRNWRYRIDDQVLEMRNGIFVKIAQYLPLSRLQHVDLQSGPIERKLGLASVICYTAGTHSAVLVLPGIARETADAIRDYLLTVGGDDGV